MSTARHEDERGKRAAERPALSVSATEAQNNFGRVLGKVAEDRVVYITKYDRPEAVVLSVKRYEALTGPGAPELEELTRRFDEMLARMQSPESAAGVDDFFAMGTQELGEAAVRGARRDPA